TLQEHCVDRVWMSSQLTCQLEHTARRVAAAAEHSQNAGKSARFTPKHDHRVHSVLLGCLRGTRSAATFLGNCAKFHRALARSLCALARAAGIQTRRPGGVTPTRSPALTRKKKARPALNLQDRPGARD